MGLARAESARKDRDRAPPSRAQVPAAAAEPDDTWEGLPDDEPADDEEAADEEGAEGDTPWQAPPKRTYPQPPAIPEPDPATAALADAWWERFMPAYRKSDLDAMLPMLDAVFAEHPAAVPHLHLDEECLLELQATMIRAGRRAELAERLLSLRHAFPCCPRMTSFHTVKRRHVCGSMLTVLSSSVGG